jgi:hypothetical protein
LSLLLTAVAAVRAIISMPSFSQLLIQRIAVIGAIADQILWHSFDHVEVEAQLAGGLHDGSPHV